jgi:hypothetical protein
MRRDTSTTAFIRRFLNGLKERQIFEASDLLSYGSRMNVDFVLREQLEKETIVRLARGLYMRGDETTPLPSPEELAIFKANSLGSSFSHLNADDVKVLNLSNVEQGPKQLVFWVDGVGCSFLYGELRIVLKTVRRKKLHKLKQQLLGRPQSV